MIKESINEVVVERKYLPEIFNNLILEISEDDGLPIVKPTVVEYFRSKLIETEIYGNVVKFFKSEKFKRIIANEMILKGNIKFNKQEFEAAAKLYERAGQWAISQSLSSEIITEAFRLAITSWISVCRIENVFRILEKENFDNKFEILNKSFTKIEAMVKHLVSNNKMEQTSGDGLLEKVKQKLKEIKPLTPNTMDDKPSSGKELL